MNGFPAALAGGLMVMGVSAVVLGRWWPVRSPRPLGRHRAAPVLETVLPPVETLDKFEGYCRMEARATIHARLRLGAVLCTECHNPSQGVAAAGGAG